MVTSLILLSIWILGLLLRRFWRRFCVFGRQNVKKVENSWGLTYSWSMKRYTFIFFFFTAHRNNLFFLCKNTKIGLTNFSKLFTDSRCCYKVPSLSIVIICLWGCWFHPWREEIKERASMVALFFSRSWRCSLLRKEFPELFLNCTYMTWLFLAFVPETESIL